MTNKTLIIEGKVNKSKYVRKWKEKFKKSTLKTAQDGKVRKKNVFLYGEQDTIISVWTSPKRTKTNPLPRVYSSLIHNGLKITIIPVLKEEGEGGEQNLLHPNTIYWMTLLGVYVVVGFYEKAQVGKIKRQASNAAQGKKSKQGKPKLAEQILELGMIEKQVCEIVTNQPNVELWNKKQIELIPSLLQASIQQYRHLGRMLGIPLKNKSLDRKELKNKKWLEDINEMFKDNARDEKISQHSETKTEHKHEDVPKEYGEKAKFNIEFGKDKNIHLTSDGVFVDEKIKQITITEAKNTISKNFPSTSDMKDGMMKLMLFGKTDFEINDVKYSKKLRSCLKGNGSPKLFQKRFLGFIEECKENHIEIRFNKMIIR